MSDYHYKGAPAPHSFNLTKYCLSHARTSPEATALIVVDDVTADEPSEHWTFAELEKAILRISLLLRSKGVAKGDRVLIRLDNRTEYALTFFACMAAGFIALPASAQLSAREIDFFISDCEPSLIVLDQTLPVGSIPDNCSVLHLEELVGCLKDGPVGAYEDTVSEDPAFLVYTSGTTASPKGVLHAHRSIWGRRPMQHGWYGIGPGDRMLHAGAFNWTYTLGTGLQDPWAFGAASIIYMGEKEPSVWPRLMEKYDVTMFAAVPTLYRQILKYADIETCDLSTLRHGLTAGEALPEFVRDEWRERTGKELYEALGMSEVSTYISCSPTVPVRFGTVGKAQAERSVVILPVDGEDVPLPAGSEGALCVHRTDPGLMLGYWRRPEADAEVYRGEWFWGGDLAVMDEEGYVTHLGRDNDVMNALGYRVSPFEIEEVLGQHVSVADVGAAEVEIKPGLSIIVAFVVPVDVSAASSEHILDFGRANLADYKVPKQVVFVDVLPKTANGKIKRAELPAVFQQMMVCG